ncbi:Glu/Leu/Phe/Val dehydrogenase dimerization domain-containing protein [Persicobacter sp. CCB-QB2]|uniref:Glu/Leu/Phe/Val dehydrogenase dimerization domain-containing protein n=1 Tax=Persicobacter sp. CCB-QB2 TaxID=1561025 RepID=UPI0006A9FDA0|nr:Glu/Leu/Phe/Val dehydrogenase dimerization domain-containing protein [Persicobacter sp. CCB-QB2]
MADVNEMKAVTENSIFTQVQRMGHEQVVFCHDEATGLKAIIGIHNTVLGPALGGTRMWDYASDEDALEDVLRLSRGMTYKNALAGLNIGGGKAVIIGDPKKVKNEALLRRFGKFVNSLGGKYVTAEDVNMGDRDMEYISYETNHVCGLAPTMGGAGNPSPVTAYGTYVGMKAAAKHTFGSDTLAGKRIAVQGAGSVGSTLVEYLTKEGATVYICDLFEDRAAQVAAENGAHVVGMEEIYDLDVDIYSPCALGATINDDTIDRLKCKIIAGAANNQLKDEIKHGKILVEKGIVYAPDFLINAGGVIHVCLDHFTDYNRDRAMAMTERIYDTCLEILEEAQKQGITPQEAAMAAAQKRIDQVAKIKSTL